MTSLCRSDKVNTVVCVVYARDGVGGGVDEGGGELI